MILTRAGALAAAGRRACADAFWGDGSVVRRESLALVTGVGMQTMQSIPSQIVFALFFASVGESACSYCPLLTVESPVVGRAGNAQRSLGSKYLEHEFRAGDIPHCLNARL
jgi:hypothetical protein